MSARFGKHNIIGSEAGAPRPIAYLRGGVSRRAGVLTRKGLWLLAAATFAVAALAWIAGLDA